MRWGDNSAGFQVLIATAARGLLFLTTMRKDTERQLSGQNERKLSNTCVSFGQAVNAERNSNVLRTSLCQFVQNHPVLHIHSMQLVVFKSFGATEAF